MFFAQDSSIEHLSGHESGGFDTQPEAPFHETRYRVIKKSSEQGHFRVFHDEYGVEKLYDFLSFHQGVDLWRGTVSVLYLKGETWIPLTELPSEMEY